MSVPRSSKAGGERPCVPLPAPACGRGGGIQELALFKAADDKAANLNGERITAWHIDAHDVVSL